MNPEYSVITNIDADHLDVHGNLDNIKKSFIELNLTYTKGSIYVWTLKFEWMQFQNYLKGNL